MDIGIECVPFLGRDPATRASPGSSLSLPFDSRLLGLLSKALSSPSSYSAETSLPFSVEADAAAAFLLLILVVVVVVVEDGSRVEGVRPKKFRDM